MKRNLLPAERLQIDYPWTVWAVGWLAVFKAFLWLAYEPVLPEALLRFVGIKYLLAALPLSVCAVGLWNRRRWAVWGLAFLAVLDLLLLLARPQSFYAYLIDSEVFLFSVILSAVVLVCSGPLGNLLILCAVPSLLKHSRPGAP
jgi:hypothetical protein